MAFAQNSDRYSSSPARSHRQDDPIRSAIRNLPSILSEKQISKLREHKYASEGTTLMDPYMQVYWKWLVELCPLWVAPNLITIVALIINIVTSVALMILSKNGKEQVRKDLSDFLLERKEELFFFIQCSGWVYFITALGLFIYQSLDAIDGKQARRTNTSSPLGELFDHGCDSVSAGN